RTRRIPARWRDGLVGGSLGDVGEAQRLPGIQVVQIAPELVEAVGGWQGISDRAQMVLAELAGVVTQIAPERRECGRAGSEIGRAAGQLWRDHAGAQRMHAREECVPSR